jgi:hypothetical protein
MSLITEAERALIRNWRSILLYIGLCVLVIGVYRAGVNELEHLVPESVQPKPAWYASADLFADIALACVMALLQACAYARLGRDIDRPLWKCRDDREAITRFAVIWAILNLSYFALLQMQTTLDHQGQIGGASAVGLMALLWNLIYVPIGVCLMHQGGLKDLRLGDALLPLLHFLPRTMLVVGLGFLQLVLFEWLAFSVPEPMRNLPWIIAAINIPLIYLECLAVAIMWISCAEYRIVAAEQTDDDDFDF